MKLHVVVPCDKQRFSETVETMLSWPALRISETQLFPCCEGGVSPTQKMNRACQDLRVTELLAFVHSDVAIYEEGWGQRVLAEFEDPGVGVVGFGGATGLGAEDIYKVPYELNQLARFGYASNTVDAEFHGDRERGSRDVAVLDGFCLVVRREILVRMGGWPAELPFHMYEAFVSLMARRYGFRTRIVGVECQHFGGGHSIKGDWQKRCVEEFGLTDAQIHARAHDYIYETFREDLPVRV